MHPNRAVVAATVAALLVVFAGAALAVNAGLLGGRPDRVGQLTPAEAAPTAPLGATAAGATGADDGVGTPDPGSDDDRSVERDDDRRDGAFQQDRGDRRATGERSHDDDDD